MITWECKIGSNARPGVTLADIIDAPDKCTLEKAYLLQWIAQVCAAAKSAKTPFWALVHRRDHREAVIYLPEILFRHLFVQCDFFEANLLCASVSLDGGARIIKIVAMPLADFFRVVRPDDIRRLADAHCSRNGA